MPEPNTAVTSPEFGSDAWLTDAPGGDIPVGDLLIGKSAETPTTAGSVATSPAAQPQTAPTTAPAVLIKTKTGTVYKSVEDATRGTEEKDTLITQMRQRIASLTGIDPISNQPVQPQTAQEVSYAQNKEAFVRDLGAAYESGDKDRIYNTHAKFLFDLLQPIAPVISDSAKASAVSTVETEFKDFRSFRNSPEFESTIDKFPVLKNAIKGSEADFRFHGQLPELYKMAYKLYSGDKTAAEIPALVEQAKQQATQTKSAPPVRPTTTPVTTLAPPQQQLGARAGGHEARAARIAAAEAAGILDAPIKW